MRATSARSQTKWWMASLSRRRSVTTKETAARSPAYRASGCHDVLALGSRTLGLCMRMASTSVDLHQRSTCSKLRYVVMHWEMDGGSTRLDYALRLEARLWEAKREQYHNLDNGRYVAHSVLCRTQLTPSL